MGTCVEATDEGEGESEVGVGAGGGPDDEGDVGEDNGALSVATGKDMDVDMMSSVLMGDMAGMDAVDVDKVEDDVGEDSETEGEGESGATTAVDGGGAIAMEAGGVTGEEVGCSCGDGDGCDAAVDVVAIMEDASEEGAAAESDTEADSDDNDDTPDGVVESLSWMLLLVSCGRFTAESLSVAMTADGAVGAAETTGAVSASDMCSDESREKSQRMNEWKKGDAEDGEKG
ncbi:hypothetical protein EDD11_004699 [Mortierella claussenii]|nr:hypothetical protein EDD11_004699 [Mortierella claussenii]